MGVIIIKFFVLIFLTMQIIKYAFIWLGFGMGEDRMERKAQ